MVQGINEKILSLNFKEFKAEIKTADAQKSYKEGVTVLVTGCLTGKDNMRRKFAQSFFLAPQDNGYFVLNDVFRYVEDDEPSELPPVSGDGDAAAVKITPEPGKIIIKKFVTSLFKSCIHAVLISLQNPVMLLILPPQTPQILL